MHLRLTAGIGLLSLALSLTLVAGCGKGNMFSFAHSSGSSGDTASLSSDAYTALANKDYAKALECYNKILENDPANSEAIYGAAAADLALSGLDVADLVANMVKQHNSPMYNGLSPAISCVAPSEPSNINILPQSIIVNIGRIGDAINRALSSNGLTRIVSGRADGKISPQNPNVNINMAFCLVLRAAIKVNQIIVFSTDYRVIAVDNSDPVRTANIANDAAKDIISAYHRLLTAAEQLNILNDNDASINKIRGDVYELIEGDNGLRKTLQRDYGITLDPNIRIDQDYLY